MFFTGVHISKSVLSVVPRRKSGLLYSLHVVECPNLCGILPFIFPAVRTEDTGHRAQKKNTTMCSILPNKIIVLAIKLFYFFHQGASAWRGRAREKFSCILHYALGRCCELSLGQCVTIVATLYMVRCSYDAVEYMKHAYPGFEEKHTLRHGWIEYKYKCMYYRTVRTNIRTRTELYHKSNTLDERNTTLYTLYTLLGWLALYAVTVTL